MRRYALALLLLSCSSAVPDPYVAGALCTLNAVKDLPRDPEAVTLGQMRQVARSLRDCERQGDAGAE